MFDLGVSRVWSEYKILEFFIPTDANVNVTTKINVLISLWVKIVGRR